MNFRLLITAIVFTITAPQGATTFAAEADDTNTPQERSEETLPADEASTEATTSSDVFIPTEDISEDFAVSFPVDI